jgi:phage-related protein
MTATLSASYVPAEPLTVERSPRIRRGPAADQLEQGGTIGRAQDLRIWPSLRFVLLPADGVALDAFLAAREAVGEPFYWTPVGDSQRLVRCREWRLNLASCDHHEVSAKFEEVVAL